MNKNEEKPFFKISISVGLPVGLLKFNKAKFSISVGLPKFNKIKLDIDDEKNQIEQEGNIDVGITIWDKIRRKFSKWWTHIRSLKEILETLTYWLVVIPSVLNYAIGEIRRWIN